VISAKLYIEQKLSISTSLVLSTVLIWKLHQKQIAYWPDGYFIADDEAANQGGILDSVDAFGSGKHTLMNVPVGLDHESMQEIVNGALVEVEA